jgi:FkbM family methyltransferase
MTIIYDIGLHNGDDTAHYLGEGATVVAIDANPSMCAAAEARFSDEISAGRLRIINKGVSDSPGVLTFWICETVSEWSSFHREIASRNGEPYHSVEVDCTPISEIIAVHGVADYMKIDIEGNDDICIKGLTPSTAPEFISIEMSHATGSNQIDALSELGFENFKIICQNDFWRQVNPQNMKHYDSSGILSRHSWGQCKLRRMLLRISGRNEGESGPWGERTPGAWYSAETAKSVCLFLRDLDARENTKGLGWWFDIHAKRGAMRQ